MGLRGEIWDQMAELAVWSKATADEVDGRGQVEVAGDTRNDVEHCALPGFYSVVAASDQLVLLRRDDGGISIAAKTARPSGATTGDRGILTDDINFRARGAMFSLIKRTGSVPLKVCRDGDDCVRNATMVIWMGQVEAALNALAPGAVTPFAEANNSIADVDATSTITETD